MLSYCVINFGKNLGKNFNVIYVKLSTCNYAFDLW